MQISLKITLDSRFTRKDGTKTIGVRIIKDRAKSFIPSIYKIAPQNFIDLGANEFALKNDKNIKSTKYAVSEIEKLKEDIEQHIEKLKKNDVLRNMTATEIKQSFLNKTQTGTFNTFILDFEKQLRQANRFGYADTFKSAEKFLKEALLTEINISDFNFNTIKKLEAYHLSNNPNGWGGLQTYLKTIRVAYYHYYKVNQIRLENNAFENYEIKNKRTRKKATSIELIKLFRDYKCEGGKKNAQLMYMFSFYNAGMNLIDMAMLKVGDVNEMLYYKRQKIQEPIQLKINQESKNILAYFSKGKKKGQYIFPLFNDGKSYDENYKIYKNRRGVINRHINDIYKAIGVESDKNISFYSARHTWASRANELNKPIAAISKGLGHSDIKTTQIYLDDLKNNVVDDLNADVTNLD